MNYVQFYPVFGGMLMCKQSLDITVGILVGNSGSISQSVTSVTKFVTSVTKDI
jgi:hypothetical protein